MEGKIVDIQIEFIKELVVKGELRQNIFEKFKKEWPATSYRLFERRLAEAKKPLKTAISAIRERVEEALIQDGEIHKMKIINAIERRQILTEIASGQGRLQQEVNVKGKLKKVELSPGWNDRIKAIVVLNKMDGNTSLKETREREFLNFNITN